LADWFRDPSSSPPPPFDRFDPCRRRGCRTARPAVLQPLRSRCRISRARFAVLSKEAGGVIPRSSSPGTPGGSGVCQVGVHPPRQRGDFSPVGLFRKNSYGPEWKTPPGILKLKQAHRWLHLLRREYVTARDPWQICAPMCRAASCELGTKATVRRAEANVQNAQKRTGPRTPDCASGLPGDLQQRLHTFHRWASKATGGTISGPGIANGQRAHLRLREVQRLARTERAKGLNKSSSRP